LLRAKHFSLAANELEVSKMLYKREPLAIVPLIISAIMHIYI